MGRWDALKPDKPNEGSGQPKFQTQSSTRFGKHSVAVPQTRFPRDDHSRWKSFAEPQGRPRQCTSWASVLDEELDLYEKNDPRYDKSRIQKILNEISNSSKERRIGVSLPAIIRLLKIQDKAMQETSLGIISDRATEDLPAGQAAECVGTLTKFAMLQPTSSAIMQCLGLVTAGQAKFLPAEETSDRVIGSILLPFIDVPGLDNREAIAPICKSMEQLLYHAHFSSAMLAPLVQDVNQEGKEETISNPIRRRLFRSLQEKLFAGTDDDVLRGTVCSFLVTMIEKIHKMNRFTAPNADVKELDLVKLEHYLADQLRVSSTLYAPSSRLLIALLRHYPVTKLGTRLLFSGSTIDMVPDSQEIRTCSHYACEPIRFTPFLASVHESLGTSDSYLGLNCLTELLVSLPMELWVTQSGLGRGAVSGFYRKVVDALVNILTICKSAVLRERGKTEAMGSLCKQAFLHIPWHDDQVIKAGEDLWESLIGCLDDSDKPYRKAISDILVHGLGGKVTPDGNLTVMIPPARLWISQEGNALPFLQKFLEAMFSERCPVMRNLFCAILRSHPESAIPCWESIVNLVHHSVASDDIGRHETCAHLFEALLLGRKDFPSEKMREVSSMISSFFFDVVARLQQQNENVKIRHGILKSYTALTADDWSFLEKDRPLLDEHVELLFNACSDKKADLRRASCKAVGEFCALFFDSSRLSEDDETSSSIATFVNRILTVMSERLRMEGDASAMAMVIHALGNLALALSENDGLWILDNTSAVRVSNEILFVLDNNFNDKVVGNAVRAIGHLGSILIFFGENQSVVDIVNALSDRVARTVSVASHHDQAMMTWAERSSAKKHGWGACHSLGRMFHAITDEEPPMVDALRNGVVQLSQCLSQARTLSEKVVLASMAALLGLKPSCLMHVLGDSDVLGEALVGVCTLVLSENSNTRFVRQGEPLLAHLLSCASANDAAVFLKSNEASPTILNNLYLWMVEREMDGRAFEAFALALQRPLITTRTDVSLEQHFASRALMQYKKDHRTKIEFDENRDEGEDEL